MFMALGVASSLWDTLQSLAASRTSSTQSAGGSQTASDPFALTGTAAPSGSTPPTGTGSSNQISPQTMSALLDAQSQSGATGTTASQSPSQALQDLFSTLDANGDGSISKQEFENALDAGGTNVTAADNVFNRLDTSGDGSVSLDELKSALQGAGGHHGHHHMHAASSTGSTDGSSNTDPDSTDPLLQALNAALNSASSASASSSATSSSLTSADPLQITPISLSASTYNMIEKMLQSGSKTSASAPLSVSV